MDLSMSNKRKMATKSGTNSSKKQKPASKRRYLFDLNNDCLRNIFDRLDRQDLINIALINGAIDPENRGRFAEIAAESFAQNEPNDDEFFGVSYDGYDDFYEYDSIDLLKSFGHLIKKLRIIYSSDWFENKLIEDALTKYCSGSLVSVKFEDMIASSLYGIENCFEKVQDVEFINGICFQISNFDQLFPNANTLILRGGDFKEIVLGEWIGKCFPAVKKFYVVRGWSGEFPINTDHFKAFINLNPQLEHLEFELNEVALIAFINKKLPNLKKLKICLNLSDSSDALICSEKLCFKKLKELNIIGNTEASPLISSATMSKLTIQEGILKNSCIGLISKNRNVSILVVHGFWTDEEQFDEFIKLAGEMPKLKKLEIECKHSIESKKILNLLNTSKQLEKLMIAISCVDKFEKVEKMLTDVFRNIPYDWTFSIKKFLNIVNLKFEK